MNGQWKDILIKKISSACFVPASTGNAVHKNRPVHGLVFNEVGADKTYYFDDGTVLNTKGLEIFYLPKGSSYRAVLCKNAYGACYAINFETENELSQKPFTMSLRDAEKIHKAFKNAVNSWEHREDLAALNVTRQLYNAIFYMLKEKEKQYVGSGARARLADAESVIRERFCDPLLTVSELADLANVSTTYFRRLFSAVYGVNPKEYIERLREEKAKELLLYESMSVAEVAQLSGYTDVCHFSREFKQRVGVTPAKYRRGVKFE